VHAAGREFDSPFSQSKKKRPLAGAIKQEMHGPLAVAA
jgi:hypothetical protein